MTTPAAITDQLFGTMGHTEGAQIQVPRKIPLRIEPKTYFANERTFLAWLSMATTLGTVATAIAGFSVESEGATAHKRSISPRTVELISLTLLPISVLMIAYALFIYLSRSANIRRKEMGFFNEKVGPLGLAVIVILSLTAILVSALKDVLFS